MLGRVLALALPLPFPLPCATPRLLSALGAVAFVPRRGSLVWS